MARKNRNISEGSIDFENVTAYCDVTNQRSFAQQKLYLIDNPYVGNKRKIVHDIADSLDRHDFKFDTMLDLFSGSSMVSLFFKLLGKKVISNDLLTSSYYNAIAFVENSNLFLTQPEIDFLCNNDNPNKNSFVRDNYSTRFAPREALFLDNYRANVEIMDRLFTNKEQVRIAKASAIVMIEHYVMQHCFLGGRLNNGQILAKLEHRLEHDRNAGNEMSFKLTPIPHFKGTDGLALNLDCLDALKQSGDARLAYIDPPYGGQQSDYAQMFSFCEEYIYGKPLGELPHIINSKKFVSAKDYDRHFKEVLDNARHIEQWAISYNDSSWADIDTIKTTVSEFKKNITVVNIDYEYKYRKEQGGSTEYLILAR